MRGMGASTGAGVDGCWWVVRWGVWRDEVGVGRWQGGGCQGWGCGVLGCRRATRWTHAQSKGPTATPQPDIHSLGAGGAQAYAQAHARSRPTTHHPLPVHTCQFKDGWGDGSQLAVAEVQPPAALCQPNAHPHHGILHCWRLRLRGSGARCHNSSASAAAAALPGSSAFSGPSTAALAAAAARSVVCCTSTAVARLPSQLPAPRSACCARLRARRAAAGGLCCRSGRGHCHSGLITQPAAHSQAAGSWGKQ